MIYYCRGCTIASPRRYGPHGCPICGSAEQNERRYLTVEREQVELEVCGVDAFLRWRSKKEGGPSRRLAPSGTMLGELITQGPIRIASEAADLRTASPGRTQT